MWLHPEGRFLSSKSTFYIYQSDLRRKIHPFQTGAKERDNACTAYIGHCRSNSSNLYWGFFHLYTAKGETVENTLLVSVLSLKTGGGGGWLSAGCTASNEEKEGWGGGGWCKNLITATEEGSCKVLHDTADIQQLQFRESSSVIWDSSLKLQWWQESSHAWTSGVCFWCGSASVSMLPAV